MTWAEAGGEIVAWDPDSACALLLRASEPNGYDRVSPMRWLVHWSVVAAGGVLLHAACMGKADRERSRGVLLLGEAGFGKSTTTLACLEDGWVTCGDDAVAVFPDQLGWHATPVYAGVKTKISSDILDQTEQTQSRSPATVTWDIGGIKRVHLLTTTTRRSFADRIELDALVLLAPDEPTRAPCRRLSEADARTRIAPSTAFPLPFDRQQVLERIGRLASELPAYSLPHRPTMAESVAAVAAITQGAQPPISVIVPVFDGERYIAEALASIVGQSVGRFQIIVVDDASPDDAVDVVESLRRGIEAAGHRLDVVRLETNQGIAGARNAGLARAEADLIAFLDQDDTWPAERTAQLLCAMRRTGSDLAQGQMAFVDVMPGLHRPWIRPEWFDGEHPGAVMGAILCRAAVFDDVGTLGAGLRTGSDDVDWFSRVRDFGVHTAQIPNVVVVRKVHDRNQSRRVAADPTDLFAVVRAHLARTGHQEGAS